MNVSNSAARYFEAGENYGECGVCLCQWKEPQEAIPCRHIYCSSCIKGLNECPECCTTIERLQKPNPALLELQRHLKGKCSACSWTGTYEAYLSEHSTCNPKSVPSSSSSSNECTKGSRVGLEYFLEAVANTSNNSSSNNNNVSLQRAQQQQQLQQNMKLQDTYSLPHSGQFVNSSSSSFVPNSLRFDASFFLPKERVDKWKEEISCTASDYGLTEEEFSFLKDKWIEFATLNERTNNPELRWRDACRLLRFMNLPSHPNDVLGLFRMAMQSPDDGSVPFHVVCLWIPMSRRDPTRWYNMDQKSYNSLLIYAQIIDVEKTGLFNEEQCKDIGEQMLMRELTASEWQSILPLVVTRAEEFRGSIPFAYQTTIPREQRVKLPLHEVILLYNKFFDPKKKSALVREEAEKKSEAYQQRIRRMLMHYNPSAIPSIDQTLQGFKGQEENLLMTLVESYGPEPH